MASYFTIRWMNGIVRMLDQRKLPHEIHYIDIESPEGIADAIREMVIRGAPAIGAAAGFGLALAAFRSQAESREALLAELHSAAEKLKAARPTAVNLAWSLNRILGRLSRIVTQDPQTLRQATLDEALAIAEEDIQTNRRIGEVGLAVIPQKANIIHHCNTGALATVDFGTALGVIRTAHESGREVFVYVDETRPRLQGARLTAWELQQLGIPFKVIADSASGFLMRQGKVDLCLVGCDRVAANGDTANKIGTYNLALAAFAHGVPFYVVGPTSTIDFTLSSGDLIPIETRPAEEITTIDGIQITPPEAVAFNPAFDITPARLITGIITERGIAFPPFEKSLADLCGML